VTARRGPEERVATVGDGNTGDTAGAVDVGAAVELDGVTAWLAERVDGLVPPLEVAPIGGGLSNLTFTLTDARGARFVLRRPPLGPLLPSAHDMGREHRVMAALQGTAVPVPPVVGLCDDVTVTGAPFMVTRMVDGLAVRGRADAEALAPEARATAGRGLADVLAALHLTDPVAVGLGELGRPDGYVERQLKRWRRQWVEGGGRDHPAFLALHDRLAAAVPEQVRPAIVHGDLRVDNAIIGPDGTVRAVVDWELCTLGDPLADLGMTLAYWAEPLDDASALEDPPTAVPGFGSRADFTARYAERTGFDVTSVPFHTAFAMWKIAAILEGVTTRRSHGAVGAPVPADETARGHRRVDDLVARATVALDAV
jgi:aminoglycoside phosphotransferase (APT) family kinase protein